MANTIDDNTALSRFEMDVGGHIAFMTYRRDRDVIVLAHTEVPKELSGQGIGSALVRGVLDALRSERMKVVAKCPFVSAYVGRHPEYQDLLA